MDGENHNNYELTKLSAHSHMQLLVFHVNSMSRHDYISPMYLNLDYLSHFTQPTCTQHL